MPYYAYYKNVGSVVTATAAATASAAGAVAIPDNANAVIIGALGANAVITLDGTTPTAEVGFQVTGGVPQTFPLGFGSVIRHIRGASTDAKLTFQFIRQR